jgi:predicted nucleic acid binding AN1-type Zn finger protein
MNFESLAPIILAISQVVIAYLQKKHTDTSDSEIRMLKNMQADSQMAITRLQASEKENKDIDGYTI